MLLLQTKTDDEGSEFRDKKKKKSYSLIHWIFVCSKMIALNRILEFYTCCTFISSSVAHSPFCPYLPFSPVRSPSCLFLIGKLLSLCIFPKLMDIRLIVFFFWVSLSMKYNYPPIIKKVQMCQFLLLLFCFSFSFCYGHK